MSSNHIRRSVETVLAAAAAGLFLAVPALAGPALAGTGELAAASPSSVVVAVGAENEYANVIAQIGGPYVSVTAIMSNPNTDPHEFEASASVAEIVSKAELIVQNGVGYDTFMQRIEAASPRRGRDVIVAQQLDGFSSNIFNPHLWYNPKTMPLVAAAVASDLSKLEPAHAAYFAANDRAFVRSLQPWLAAVANFKHHFDGTPVAVTEPVADYMLQAAGADIRTPDSLQAAIMNGTDPSPQNISLEESLISRHEVKVFLYNQQVTDSLTSTFLSDAHHSHVPVVGVYETMPVPGYDYQSWMLAEVDALQAAVTRGTSTERL
ncbi:MAG TPA: zinc ABC transporter substrate-binding protein [Acidimicrobiales bacterium]|nr:zinc ABC transporter substrate-binding protein [Acidimicrobiales bacterium]